MKTLALRVVTGQFAWLERRLFEILGGWVPTVAEPEVKVLLRAQSFEHAWHADLWEELAPRSGPAGDGAPAPARPLAPVLDAVAAPSATVERLVGVYRVLLPRLVDAYRALSDAAVPASDGPVVRALGLMLADDVPAMEDAERLIGGLGGEGGAPAHQRRIEALLAEAGSVKMPDSR